MLWASEIMILLNHLSSSLGQRCSSHFLLPSARFGLQELRMRSASFFALSKLVLILQQAFQWITLMTTCATILFWISLLVTYVTYESSTLSLLCLTESHSWFWGTNKAEESVENFRAWTELTLYRHRGRFQPYVSSSSEAAFLVSDTSLRALCTRCRWRC